MIELYVLSLTIASTKYGCKAVRDAKVSIKACSYTFCLARAILSIWRCTTVLYISASMCMRLLHAHCVLILQLSVFAERMEQVLRGASVLERLATRNVIAECIIQARALSSWSENYVIKLAGKQSLQMQAA